jgi:NitT/TauT family transport system ATP-binding protein
MVATTIGRVATEGSSLSVQNVKKDFPSSDRTTTRTLALDTVSFSVTAGEFVSIVGPSAGVKSTLLRLIAGLDFPSSGELRIGQEVITGANAERGLVFQDPNLFQLVSVAHRSRQHSGRFGGTGHPPRETSRS